MDNAKCGFAINHAAMNLRVPPPYTPGSGVVEDRPALVQEKAGCETRNFEGPVREATARLTCRCHASATAQSRLLVQQKPGVLPLPPPLAL
jgi:hypothetical protein